MSLFLRIVTSAIGGSKRSSSSVLVQRAQSVGKSLMTAIRAVKSMISGSSKPSEDVSKSDLIGEFYTEMVEKAISEGFSKNKLDLSGDGTAVKNFGGLEFSNLPKTLKDLTFDAFNNMTESQLKALSSSTNIHLETLKLLKQMFKTTYKSDEKTVTQDVSDLLSNINMNLSNSKSSQKVDGKIIGVFGTGVTKLYNKIKEIGEQAELDKDKSIQEVLAQFLSSKERDAISKALRAQTKGDADASEERFDSKLELGDLDVFLKKVPELIPDFVDFNGNPISKNHQDLIQKAYFDLLNKLKTDINKNPSNSSKIIKQFHKNIKSILNFGRTNQATYSLNQPKSLAKIPFKSESRMGRFAALMSLVVGDELTSSAPSVSSGESSPRSGSISTSPRSTGSYRTNESTGSNGTDARTKSSLDEWEEAFQDTVDGSKDLSSEIQTQLNEQHAEKQEMKEAERLRKQEERDQKIEMKRRKSAAARASSEPNRTFNPGKAVEQSVQPFASFFKESGDVVQNVALRGFNDLLKALDTPNKRDLSQDQEDRKEEKEEKKLTAKFAQRLKEQAKSSEFLKDRKIIDQCIEIDGQIRELYTRIGRDTDRVDQEVKKLIDNSLDKLNVPQKDRDLLEQLFLIQ